MRVQEETCEGAGRSCLIWAFFFQAH